MQKSKSDLLALIEVLVGKGVISTTDARRVKEVSDLVKLLVAQDLVTEEEVEELTIMYGDFLNQLLVLYQRGVHDKDLFNRLKEKFGVKFPKIFTLLEQMHENPRQGHDTADAS